VIQATRPATFGKTTSDARVSTDVKEHCAEETAIPSLWAVDIRQRLRGMSHVRAATCRQHPVQGDGKTG